MSGLSNSSIKVFPQPASNRVTLESSLWKNTTVGIQLCDLSGKQLQSSLLQANSSGAVDLAIALPKGVYLITSTANGSKSVVKLLID
jgi:hypothetical protein